MNGCTSDFTNLIDVFAVVKVALMKQASPISMDYRNQFTTDCTNHTDTFVAVIVALMKSALPISMD